MKNVKTTGRVLPVAIATLFMVSQPANALDLNVYGVGHLSADNVDDGQDSSLYLTSNSSRFGFSGEQTLTAGMKVIFQLETGLDLTAQGTNDGNGPANSGGQIFTKGRPSFIGLEGKFGKVVFGHLPALDQWANSYNLFADQVGDLGNLWEASGLPGRADNVMYYATPNINGFETAVSYVPEEGDADRDLFILKTNYDMELSTRGSLRMDAAYSSVGQGVGVDDHSAMVFTFGYNSARFSFGGGFQSESDIGGVSGMGRDSYFIGSSYNITDKGKFKAQWATSSGDTANTDATQFAIGYDHDLGEQTIVYAAYASMDNDSNVNFAANGKGHGDKVTPALGDSPNVLSFGIIYKFDKKL